jgi:hypothetical protein
MKSSVQKLRTQSKICLWIVILGLAISGLTAFPIEGEMSLILKYNEVFPITLQVWLLKVYEAIRNTNHYYPFISYGTDWLAFAHLMLAVLFIGPLRDPIKNRWVIEFGIICCISIIPLALIAGNMRQIPIFWQLIDCSFGLFGIIPLLLCHRSGRKIETLEAK